MYLHYSQMHMMMEPPYDIIGKTLLKGVSSFLFTIGNADFELNTSVILSASGNMLFS